MFYDFISILYLAIPAFVANMMPIVAAKLHMCPQLAIPIDCGKKMRGREILGKNKTIRGLLIGMLSSTLIALIQFYLPFFEAIKFDTATTAILFGIVAGFGALFGDAIASIIKRQSDVPSGKPLIPLDQIDYIIGFIVFTLPFISWSFLGVFFLLGFALIANPLTNLTAYLFGIKNTYW